MGNRGWLLGLMDMSPRVLVIGATQGTGWHIANLLLQEGYRVRALARNEAKAKRALSSAVEVVVGDITTAHPRSQSGIFRTL